MGKLGITVLRMVVGGLFIGHGLQKLTGWFGGHGLDATGQAFDSMGLQPGKPAATAAGVAETAGGALLVTGFLTPVGASLVTGVMAVAVERVHGRNGPWVSNNGYEYNLVLTAAAFAVAAEGPGPLSLDRALGTERSGVGIACASLVAGLAGAAAVVRVTARRAQQQPAAAPPTAEPTQAQEQQQAQPREAA
jgi:putative oxidoreductase